jgi:hypothetical protein
LTSGVPAAEFTGLGELRGGTSGTGAPLNSGFAFLAELGDFGTGSGTARGRSSIQGGIDFRGSGG